MMSKSMSVIILSVIILFAFLPLAFAQEETSEETPEVKCPDGYVCTINDNTSRVDSNTDSTTTVISPPPSAIAPSINSTNSDLCTVGVSGAVQTQIFGMSSGKTTIDVNCEKLKNARQLYNMGMKVAAVSVMCQDPRVFEAMMQAGTPCPYDGMIGSQAKAAWEENPQDVPGEKNKKKPMDEKTKQTLIGVSGMGLMFLLLLL